MILKIKALVFEEVQKNKDSIHLLIRHDKCKLSRFDDDMCNLTLYPEMIVTTAEGITIACKAGDALITMSIKLNRFYEYTLQ